MKPDSWKRGFAVKIYDPEVEQNFSGINVTFHYSDGSTAVRNSDRGGYALVPLRSSATIDKIDLEIVLESETKKESFPLTSIREGILPVIFRSSAVTPVAFDVMKLDIDGEVLVGYEGRGRYQRSP
jgi:hypothetical protein